MLTTHLLRSGAIALALATFGAPALAAFPEKPVKIIVPNTPGGPVDIPMRLVANDLSKKWGQAVIVENRPGGSGIVAVQAMLQAPADGYTLGSVIAATMTIVPFAVDKVPYDTQKDLVPVTTIARTPFIFLVPANSPIKTWQDVVQTARSRELKLGSYSLGTSFHLVWERIARQAGIKALYVPSPSPTKTQTDLANGLLDVSLDSPSSGRPLIDAGRLRAIAITSPQRFSGLPNVPTLAEGGLRNLAVEPWYGVVVKVGTPADVVTKVQRDIAEIITAPAAQKQLEFFGQIGVGDTPAQFDEAIRRDRAVMEPLVKELNIRLQ